MKHNDKYQITAYSIKMLLWEKPIDDLVFKWAQIPKAMFQKIFILPRRVEAANRGAKSVLITL